jgi:hypothetical protein
MNPNARIQQLIGVYPIVPLHPLCTAFILMEQYDSLEQAINGDETHEPAIASLQVPGERTAFGQAMTFLKEAQSDLDQAVSKLFARWEHCYAGGYAELVDVSQQQGRAIEPAVRKKIASWFK